MDERGIRAFKALLDFIYLAQYPSHDDIILGYMEEALDQWKECSNWFIKNGIREHFNIPKLHSLFHYIHCIWDFGATDNYKTELFKCLHIERVAEIQQER